jgi:hypothetical protein
MFEVLVIVVLVSTNAIMFNIGFRYGIKTEQQARLRRVNQLKRLLK